MMMHVVKQDDVMHDGFQDATSADEQPKARYVTFKILLLSGINDVIRNECVLIMMIYIVKQDNVLYDALLVK